MKKFLLGTIAALTFTGTAQAQTTSNDVFAAYCIGVFQVHMAHTLLYEDKVTRDSLPAVNMGDTSFWDKRVKQLREYLFKQALIRHPKDLGSGWPGGHTSGEHDTLEQALEAGLDDASECYKTGHERGSICHQEGQNNPKPMSELCKQVVFSPEWWECAKTRLGSFNQDAYDSCQRRLEPESCRRYAKCGDLSRLSIN
jgi:hypothetical protein